MGEFITAILGMVSHVHINQLTTFMRHKQNTFMVLPQFPYVPIKISDTNSMSIAA
jgi:hypothetical protein